MRDNEREIIAIYQHPQGKTITVFDDDTYECRGPDGKKKPTSATPSKLVDGYGAWERIY